MGVREIILAYVAYNPGLKQDVLVERLSDPATSFFTESVIEEMLESGVLVKNENKGIEADERI